MFAQTVRAATGPALVFALGGCATYSAPRPAYAYFSVPCSTPGAFVAQPLDPETGNPLPHASASQVPSTPEAAAPTTTQPPNCMIAAAIRPEDYASGYYGGYGSRYYGPYAGYGGYGFPFFGSIGVGIYGGHGWSGHSGHGYTHGGGHGGGHAAHGGH